MVDQRVHIIISYGTRGRHVEASPALLHASDYYMGCMCTFYLAIEQSRQVIISQSFGGFYWLSLRHVIIFTPAKTVQWINAPLVLEHERHNKWIKDFAICRLLLDLAEVTSAAMGLFFFPRFYFFKCAFGALTHWIRMWSKHGHARMHLRRELFDGVINLCRAKPVVAPRSAADYIKASTFIFCLIPTEHLIMLRI